MTEDYDDDLILDEGQYDEDTGSTEDKQEVEQQEDHSESEVKHEKKPSRFEKRVGELTWKAKTAEEKAQALAAQNEELQKRIQEYETKLHEVDSEQTTEKIKQLKQAKIEALEIGDNEKVAELDDEILDLRLASKNKPVQQERKQEQVLQQQQVDVRTQAQIEWEASHPDVLSDRKKSEKANRILQRLVQEAGIAPDDPKLWTLLDRNMNRTKPPAPAGNGTGSETGDNTSVAGLTRADFEHMKQLGYDPKNKVFQAQYLRAKRNAANG
jgi:hypothetical protein